MKRLTLSDGTTALLDDADHARVRHLPWRPHPRGLILEQRDPATGRRHYTLLHRHLLGAKPCHVVVFVNDNPRDLRRINLALMTKAEHNRAHGNHPPRAPQHVGGVHWASKQGRNNKRYVYARAMYRGDIVDFSTLRYAKDTAWALAEQWLAARRAADHLADAARRGPGTSTDATLADALHAHRADFAAPIGRGGWLATDYDTLRQHSHAYAAHG